MVAHTYSPSTREAKAGGSSQVCGQPGLHSKFQVSQDYLMGLYLIFPNK